MARNMSVQSSETEERNILCATLQNDTRSHLELMDRLNEHGLSNEVTCFIRNIDNVFSHLHIRIPTTF